MPVDLSTLPLGTHSAPLDGQTTTYISLHPFDDQNPPRHVPTPATVASWFNLSLTCSSCAPVACLALLHRAMHSHDASLPEPPTIAEVQEAAASIRTGPTFSLPQCLRAWKATRLWRSTLTDYAGFLPSEITCLLHAIATHGGVALGLRLPFAWQTDTLWDVGCGYDYRPNSWGYFAVPAVAYTPAHVEVIAWGQVRTLTHDAVARYAAEAYVPLGIRHHASTPTHRRKSSSTPKVSTV